MAGAVEADSSRGFRSMRLSGIAEWLRPALTTQMNGYYDVEIPCSRIRFA